MTSGLLLDKRYKHLDKYKYFSKSIWYGIYMYTLGPFVALFRALIFIAIYALGSILPSTILFNICIPMIRRLMCVSVTIKRPMVGDIGEDEVILSNHACYKDFLAMIHCIKRKNNNNNIIIPTKLLFPNTIKNLKFIEVSYKKGSDEVKKQLNQKGNILIFPEGAFNDGTYTYKFYKHTFSLGKPIRPIAFKIKFCCDHYMRMHNASWFGQLYALLAIPYVHYDAYVLDRMEIKDGEDPIDFAERCRENICEAVNIEKSPYIFKNIKQLL